MSGIVSIVTRQCGRRHYYGYGSVIDKRRFRSRGAVEYWTEDSVDVLRRVVMDSCVGRLIEFGRVL
jgi:hypothetical protein